jgi:hypothetical protein
MIVVKTPGTPRRKKLSGLEEAADRKLTTIRKVSTRLLEEINADGEIYDLQVFYGRLAQIEADVRKVMDKTLVQIGLESGQDPEVKRD